MSSSNAPTGQAPAHRSVTSIRSAPPEGPHTPTTPQTPPRPIHSTFGSPASIRADDDLILLEIGSRHLRAGFAGDSCPKVTLSCNPEDQRRAGDFRDWLDPKPKFNDAWSSEYEIWQHDIRKCDLGLFTDKLDRMLREAFMKHLLVDSRPRRAGLVLDSALPLPLLSCILDTLFKRFQTPLVSLISSPVMSAVAAGVRSALVVDMGWTETVITSIYEYREVKSTRTVRSGRFLVDELHDLCWRQIKGPDTQMLESDHRVVNFEDCEDVIYRLMWCRPSSFKSSQRQSTLLETVEEEQDELPTGVPSPSDPSGQVTVQFELLNGSKPVDLTFNDLADVCDHTFFDHPNLKSPYDYDVLPLHVAVHQHLLEVPVDVRAACLPRIIFTGGCSNILGIKERAMDELKYLIGKRGWETTSGVAFEHLKSKKNLRRSGTEPPQNGEEPSRPLSSTSVEQISEQKVRAAHLVPEEDPIEAKVLRGRPKPVTITPEPRAVHSLGSWTGASLLCHLKIPIIATVDKELWIQHGINGASRASDVDVKTQQRQSAGASGLIRSNGRHQANWTLGTWGVV